MSRPGWRTVPFAGVLYRFEVLSGKSFWRRWSIIFRLCRPERHLGCRVRCPRVSRVVCQCGCRCHTVLPIGCHWLVRLRRWLTWWSSLPVVSSPCWSISLFLFSGRRLKVRRRFRHKRFLCQLSVLRSDRDSSLSWCIVATVVFRMLRRGRTDCRRHPGLQRFHFRRQWYSLPSFPCGTSIVVCRNGSRMHRYKCWATCYHR